MQEVVDAVAGVKSLRNTAWVLPSREKWGCPAFPAEMGFGHLVV